VHGKTLSETALVLHTFKDPFSGTTQVSQYQKGKKTNLDFTEERDSEWQWHQLGHTQVSTLLQTDNHASTPPLFFTGRMPFLSPNQQCQSTKTAFVTKQKLCQCLASSQIMKSIVNKMFTDN